MSIFAAMGVLWFGGIAVAYPAESRPNPAVAMSHVDQSGGNLEGKEVRFGTAASSLFAVVTTDTSTVTANFSSSELSFSPPPSVAARLISKRTLFPSKRN